MKQKKKENNVANTSLGILQIYRRASARYRERWRGRFNARWWASGQITLMHIFKEYINENQSCGRVLLLRWWNSTLGLNNMTAGRPKQRTFFGYKREQYTLAHIGFVKNGKKSWRMMSWHVVQFAPPSMVTWRNEVRENSKLLL